MATVATDRLLAAAIAVLDEAYVGPADPNATWFADNEPRSGLIGSLDGVSASEASQPVGDGTTIAAHVNHVRFALNLANRAFRGEEPNPFSTADWDSSWSLSTVDESEWKGLIDELRREYELTADVIRRDIDVVAKAETNDALTGLLGLIGHGAWHLGAVRKMIEVVRKA